MTQVQRPARPEEIRFSSEHVLFVEGGEGSLDPLVLKTLLKDKIDIQPMGKSSEIRAAANALFPYHPNYYFLIDRDHFDDSIVEKSWRNFPDKKQSNILVWRRRELENYFLIPEFISQSEYLKPGYDEARLKSEIAGLAHKRIFLDAAGIVIIGLREELKQTWITAPTNTDGYESKAIALKSLLAMSEFAGQKDKVSKMLDKEFIREQFDKTVEELLGDAKKPEFGEGKWLERISGKSVLPTVVHKCFAVKNAAGKTLQKPDMIKRVAKKLLELPIEKQPVDFKKLYNLIKDRIEKTKLEQELMK